MVNDAADAQKMRENFERQQRQENAIKEKQEAAEKAIQAK
jgi:hypothetical protein